MDSEDDKVVEFTVDTTLFRTTLATLKNYPDSLLYKTVTTDMISHKLSNGSYFVDRDSKYFGLILNFYRMGPKIVSMLPIDQTELNAIKLECDYYCIPDITAMIPEWVDVVCDSKHDMTMHGRTPYAYHYKTTLKVDNDVYEISISNNQIGDMEGKCMCGDEWKKHIATYGNMKKNNVIVVKLSPCEDTAFNEDIVNYLIKGGKVVGTTEFKKLISILLTKSKEDRVIKNLTRKLVDF